MVGAFDTPESLPASIALQPAAPRKLNAPRKFRGLPPVRRSQVFPKSGFEPLHQQLHLRRFRFWQARIHRVSATPAPCHWKGPRRRITCEDISSTKRRGTISDWGHEASEIPLAAIDRKLGRSPSTVSREIRRNAYPTDGRHKPLHACGMARGRRRRARQGTRFRMDDWLIVRKLLERMLSPKQISGTLCRQRVHSVSHETIYQHIWDDLRHG